MKTLLLAMSLAVTTLSASASAYERQIPLDSFNLRCQIQGRGVSENMEVKGWIQQGFKSGKISSGVLSTPGIFDKNYNPNGSKALLAVLVKELGSPKFAFISGNSQSAADIVKGEYKFPENFSFSTAETSWNNDSNYPDATFTYEILNLRGEDAYLRFTINFPNSRKIAYFGGACEKI